MTVSPQLLSSRFVSVSLLAVAVVNITLALASNALAQTPLAGTNRTTMVIFTDHPMDDDRWSALVRELHRSEAELSTTTREIAGDLEVLRGRDLVLGISVEVGVTVYVTGDCTLLPGPRRSVTGALGWVKKVDGQIQPFIHVDCERIVEMLQPIALGMSRERRNTVVAEAIARVVTHEWIHIATQKTAHGKDGVMQAQFLLVDLLAEDEQFGPRRQSRRDRKRQSGL